MVRRSHAIAGLSVLVAGAIAWGAVHHPSHRRTRPPPTPVAGAFRHGGTPDRDPALEALLRDQLTDLVIETDEDRHSDDPTALRTKHAAEVRDPPAIIARGPALTGAWHQLLDTLDRWVAIPRHNEHYRDAEQAIRHDAHALSEQLAALGLGYYVKGEVIVDHRAAHAALFVYRVENVAFVEAAGAPRRVLELRRLDRLNLTHSVLGMQSEDAADPVVLLDQIDEFVASHLVPVLDGRDYPLVDPTLAREAGNAIRRELSATRASATDLMRATVRRHEARHAIDLDRDEPLATPLALERLLGDVDGDAPFARRARAELAAYLSQIINDPATPHLALWNLASHTLQKDRWGTAEAYAGVVILQGLARRLGHVPSHTIVARGQLDRGELVALALPLTALDDDTLRRTARELWTELYAEPVLTIADAVAPPG